VSGTAGGDDIDEYLNAMKKEIDIFSMSSENRGEKLGTVYFGGGTPSLMTSRQIGDLLRILNEKIGMEDDAEITVECNPGSINGGVWLREVKQAGVNRISIGSQSFNNDILRFLGRVHDASLTRVLVDEARKAGITSIGMDLMYGIPGQTLEDVEKDAKEITVMHPEHVSIYCLSIEPETPFGMLKEKGVLTAPDDGLTSEMYYTIDRILRSSGYEWYEISNYAVKNRECRHNIAYWRSGDYAGFGVSACSHLKGLRWENVSSAEEYVKMIDENVLPRKSGEYLSMPRKIREGIVMKLRTSEGFDPEDITNDYREEIIDLLDSLVLEGCLNKTGKGTYVISERKRFISDWIFSKII